MNLNIQSALPNSEIEHFVHSFWMVENATSSDIPSTVLPNGMVDMVMMRVDSQNWELLVRGIDTMPSHVIIKAGTKMFSAGFKLLAVEYLFENSIKDVLNEGKNISNAFWQFDALDMLSFEAFCNKVTQKIMTLSKLKIDKRKADLFDLIYKYEGTIRVKELSDEVHWSSRQINRYFNQQFGLSLKTYCNILKVGASFKDLSNGVLFPLQNYTDQNHFIKTIKKYAGATPKELSKNKNEQFINITAIKKFPL